jgi:DNA-binding Xre family transcriptional regulator
VLARDVLAGNFSMDVLAMGKKQTATVEATCLQGLWDIRHVLARTRLAKGISMNELARRTGVSPAQVYHLEKGVRMPRPATLDLICKELGLRLAVTAV